jgi:RNA polymerase sigma factor (sigma-70 family)
MTGWRYGSIDLGPTLSVLSGTSIIGVGVPDLAQMTATRPRQSNRLGFNRIEAAKRGVESAWAGIYADLAGPVVGYLRSRGARDPEDLSSEVFFQVARDIHRFHGDESKFRSWVFVIAHRRLIDERRAVGRRPDTVDEPIDDLEREGGDVEDEVMDRLSVSHVQSVLETLTEDQRNVLSLRVIGDLSLEETASVMGKRVGAIKALQRRAVASVRNQLADGRVSL